jgi:hypothetical protein
METMANSVMGQAYTIIIDSTAAYMLTFAISAAVYYQATSQLCTAQHRKANNIAAVIFL